MIQYALVSFFYIKDDIQYYLDAGHNLFVDCGAFSHVNTGKGVADIEDYAAFCHKFGDQVDAYANMDVIGDAAATYENQCVMEDLGLHPLPVFHRGDDWKYLDDYLKGDHDYIAFGGVADPRDRKAANKWMGKVISHIVEFNPTIKTHAFGVTSPEELVKYRFFSCDSSTWCDAFRYNKYQFYKGHGVLEEIDVQESRKRIGLHYGSVPLDGKFKHSLTTWKKRMEFIDRIIPSSEQPFRKAEIDQLSV